MRKSPTLLTLPAVLLLFATMTIACSGADDPPAAAVVKTLVVETDPLAIDDVYHSMEGPWQRVVLDPQDIGWITSFRTEVADAETGETLGDEFFCHSQLQLATSARLMVAASGIDEIRFPQGFGIPIKEIVDDLEAPWDELSLFGMVLNNYDADLSRRTKIRFTIDYVEPDATGVRKLYKASIPVVPNQEEEGTAAWERGDTVVLSGANLEPSELPETTKGKPGHWMVPPGKQVIRQRYRNLVGIQTSVHYGLIHMHNHGRSMQLTDLTDGVVLWSTEVAYAPGAEFVQIAAIPVYSSEEGFMLYPDHEYEIESVYDNSSAEPIDAMAVMYLYHHPLNDEHITYPIPQTAPATEDHSHQH